MEFDSEALASLIGEYLEEYRQYDLEKAQVISNELRNWNNTESEHLLDWWRTRDLTPVFNLQSYFFWLWTKKGIDYKVFESVYYNLTPITSRSWSVPIVITTGLDDPIIEGGFRDQVFTLADYKFSPNDRGFLVEWSEPPPTPIPLDTTLSFLSFLIEKHSLRPLGFRQLTSRSTTSRETTAHGVSLSPEIGTIDLTYDFDQLGAVLERISSQASKGKYSPVELLHIRHRAIINVDLESQLIALWASIESLWGSEESDDKLLTSDERQSIKNAVKFLPKQKRDLVLNAVNSLKRQTRNQRIIEAIRYLNCANNIDVQNQVKSIHDLRSKCAHGSLLSSEDKNVAYACIRFMLSVINELITEEMLRIGIRFS